AADAGADRDAAESIGGAHTRLHLGRNQNRRRFSGERWILSGVRRNHSRRWDLGRPWLSTSSLRRPRHRARLGRCIATTLHDDALRYRVATAPPPPSVARRTGEVSGLHANQLLRDRQPLAEERPDRLSLERSRRAGIRHGAAQALA